MVTYPRESLVASATFGANDWPTLSVALLVIIFAGLCYWGVVVVRLDERGSVSFRMALRTISVRFSEFETVHWSQATSVVRISFEQGSVYIPTLWPGWYPRLQRMIAIIQEANPDLVID